MLKITKPHDSLPIWDQRTGGLFSGEVKQEDSAPGHARPSWG